MPEPDIDLAAVRDRYSRALDAKPGKGPITHVDWLTDSVCDIPDLLREVERLTESNSRLAQKLMNLTRDINDALTPEIVRQKAEAWDEGHRTGWEHCQDGNYGTDHWDDDTPNPYGGQQ